jgi:hypothetical protein
MRFVERHARSLGLAAALSALALLPGCGGSATGEVSGRVTLNGKAPDLDNLQISFLGQDGRPVNAPVGKDGSFRATGVPVGQVMVGLSYVPPEAQAASELAGKARQTPEALLQGQGGKIDPKLLQPLAKEYRPAAVRNPIPAAARDPRTSQKTVTVESGKETVLTWDVRP